MSAASVRRLTSATRGLRADDRAILYTLADGPLSANEIADLIRRDARERWLVREGIYSDQEIEEPSNVVKLLSCSMARGEGLKIHGHEIYARLCYLERHGAVERIQIEGERPMLWSSRV